MLLYVRSFLYGNFCFESVQQKVRRQGAHGRGWRRAEPRQRRTRHSLPYSSLRVLRFEASAGVLRALDEPLACALLLSAARLASRSA